jgi:hypothetical protein
VTDPPDRLQEALAVLLADARFATLVPLTTAADHSFSINVIQDALWDVSSVNLDREDITEIVIDALHDAGVFLARYAVPPRLPRTQP